MPDMTNTGSHWPGAQRRRAAARDDIDHTGALDQAAALAAQYGRGDRVDPQRETVTAARGYDARELDAAGRAALTAIVTRAGHNAAHMSDRVAVGRIPRRGYVIGITMYDHDERGDLVVVLGQPVCRQHFVPVRVDELPEAWR